MILSKYPEVHDCPAAVLNLKLQHETAVYVTVRKRSAVILDGVFRYPDLWGRVRILFDVQIGRDLIVIAGMGGIVLDVFLGNHAHLQERTEDKGVIIQYGLLHPDCQGGAFGRVEFLAQLFFQGIQLGAVVFPLVLGGMADGEYGEPVFRVPVGAWTLAMA